MNDYEELEKLRQSVEKNRKELNTISILLIFILTVLVVKFFF